MTEAVAVENHPCDECGVLDNHPMIHVLGQYVKDEGRVVIGSPSFHFDCLPAEFEALITEGPEHANTRATIEQARKGVHGDKLRTFIAKQSSDNSDEV